MADYQLTQTGAEVQDILDNSQTGKYFYNQSVATWSSDATYSDYPYKGVITLTGVKGTDGVEVTFSNADATSGNYSPICNTVANGVEIWAKAQDNALVIPTIHITTGADVQLSGDDAYLPISGGNVTGSLSVVGSPVVTESTLNPGYSTITVQNATGTIRLLKFGKLRVVYGNVKATSAGIGVVVGTLVSGDRPPIDIDSPATGYSVSAQCEAQVTASGNILVNVPSGANNNSIKFNVVYAVS